MVVKFGSILSIVAIFSLCVVACNNGSSEVAP